MLLAIDVGNTHVKLGLFTGDKLERQWRVVTVREKLADDYGILLLNLLEPARIPPTAVTGCAIASVVPPLTGQFSELARRYFGVEPVVVGPGANCGLRFVVRPIHELGADRIANCYGALRLWGGPCFVVALGTATVVDAVRADGEYLGGAIAPGVGISAQALFGAAARLFAVDLVPPSRVVATNTEEQMQSGFVHGFAGLVEGLVLRMRRELKVDWPVYATGGLAPVIAAQTDIVRAVEPELTLRGLAALHALNRS